LYTDDTEKPLKIRSFSVFSVKSVYQKGLITAIPNEPILDLELLQQFSIAFAKSGLCRSLEDIGTM
jgi:hypothetical protein